MMKKKKKRTGILPKTAALVIAVGVAAGIFLGIQFRKYEKGILDVCAVQQDGYVQLVLDQIELKDNRSDAEMIRNILGTLDSSASKYWTFSRDETMLYVKDVLETNRYKGLKTASYYSGKSAEKFIASLQKDEVTHAVITLDQKKYVASGVLFHYKKNDYRLVLLTNQAVVLDNNQYLGARTAVFTTIALLLILLVLLPMILAWRSMRQENRIRQKDEAIQKLNEGLSSLNNRFSEEMLSRNSGSIWNLSLIPEFLKRLKQRGISSAVTVQLFFRTEEEQEDFIRNGKRLIDAEFLIFQKMKTDSGGADKEKYSLILLFPDKNEEQVRKALRVLPEQEMVVKVYEL